MEDLLILFFGLDPYFLLNGLLHEFTVSNSAWEQFRLVADFHIVEKLSREAAGIALASFPRPFPGAAGTVHVSTSSGSSRTTSPGDSSAPTALGLLKNGSLVSASQRPVCHGRDFLRGLKGNGLGNCIRSHPLPHCIYMLAE